jgi:hypothetical protein
MIKVPIYKTIQKNIRGRCKLPQKSPTEIREKSLT